MLKYNIQNLVCDVNLVLHITESRILRCFHQKDTAYINVIFLVGWEDNYINKGSADSNTQMEKSDDKEESDSRHLTKTPPAFLLA